MNLFTVFGTIGLKSEEFEQGISQATEQGRGFGDTMKTVGAAVAKYAAVAGAAVLGVGAVSIRAGMQFEGAMDTIQARTGMASDDVEGLGKTFRDMALEGRFSATEIAKAFGSVAVAGQNVNTATELMEASMTLANAVGKDLGSTAYFLGNYFLKVGIDVAYAEKYINMFAAAAQATGIGLDSLQNYLFRSNVTLQSTNISGTEATAMFGLLYQAGIRGAQAYSGLENAMRSLLVPTEDQIAALDRLGVARYDENGLLREGIPFLMDVAKALGELEGAQLSYYNQLLGSTAMGSAFLGGMVDIKDSLPGLVHDLYEAGKATGGTGMAFQMAEKQAGGLGQAFGMLRNGLTDMKLSLYGVIAVPFYDALMRMNVAFLEIAQRVRPGGDLHGPLQNIAAAFASLMEAVMNVAERALPIAITAFGLAANALSALLTVLAPVIDNIDMLLAAFAGYKAVVYATAAITAFKGAMHAATLGMAISKALIKAKEMALAALAVKAGLAKSAMGGLYMATAMLTGKKGLATVAIYAKIAAKAALASVKTLGVAAAIAAVAGGIAFLVRRLNEQESATRALINRNHELAEATKELTGRIEASADAHRDRARAIEDESDVARVMLNRIQELSKIENKSLEQRAEMAAAVEALNRSMEGLNVQYDIEAGLINKTTDEIEALIAAREAQAKADLAQEEVLGIARDRLDVEQRLREVAEQRKEAARALYNTEGMREQQVAILVASYNNLASTYYDLVNKIGELDGAFNYHSNVVAESMLANARSFAQAEYAMMGFANAAEHEMARAAQAVKKDAIEQALDFLAGEFEQAETRATDAFNRMNTNTSKSLQQMNETIQYNTAATRNWGANIAEMMEAAELKVAAGLLDEGALGHIEQFARRGPGYAQMMVNDMEHVFGELAPSLQEASEAAVGFVADAFNVDMSVAEAVSDMVSRTGMSFEEALRKVDFESLGEQIPGSFAAGVTRSEAKARLAALGLIDYVGSEISSHGLPEQARSTGYAVGQGLANGVEDSTGLAEAASSNIGNAMLKACKNMLGVASPSREGIEIGGHFVAGIAEGISSNVSKAADVAAGLGRELLSVLNSFRPDFISVGADLMSGLVQGLESRRGSVLDTARSIANEAAAAMRSALEIQSPSRATLEIGRQFCEGFIFGMESMGDKLQSTVTSVFDALRQPVAAVAGYGRDVAGKFADGIRASSSNAVMATRNMANGVKSIFGELGDAVVQASQRTFGDSPSSQESLEIGQNFVDGLSEGILSKKPLAVSKITNLGQEMLRALRAFRRDFVQAGAELVQGFIQGMESMRSAAIGAAWSIGAAAAAAMRSALNSSSPSRVTYEIGQDFGEGFILGIESMADKIQAAVKDVFGGLGHGIEFGGPATTLGHDGLEAAPGATVIHQHFYDVREKETALQSYRAMQRLAWEVG